MTAALWQQEQIVLVRSARLNLDSGRGDKGDVGEGWSFARGRFLWMIICNRPDPPDDHLHGARSSRWSFAWGLILQMIIYKWPVPPDDHLQESSPYRWSFARGNNNNNSDRGDGAEGGEEGKGEGGEKILVDGRAHGPIEGSTRVPRGPKKM